MADVVRDVVRDAYRHLLVSRNDFFASLADDFGRRMADSPANVLRDKGEDNPEANNSRKLET